MKIRFILQLFIIFGMVLLFKGFGFAQGFEKGGDCLMSSFVGDDINPKGANRKYTKIFPQEGIERAILNLKSYCCAKGLTTTNCDIDKTNGNLLNNYLESKYLYNHIVDISLRRLDAIPQLIYPGFKGKIIEPDDKGKERRTFIIKNAESIDGTTPLAFQDMNNKYWNNVLAYNLPKREDGNYNTDNAEIEKKLSNYNSWSLYNRYSNVCEVSADIYGKINGGIKDLKIRTHLYNNCKNMIQTTIKNNITYTQTIMLQKSNKLLKDNIENYTDKYFAQTRLNNLKETMIKIISTFNGVNKNITKLVNKCS